MADAKDETLALCNNMIREAAKLENKLIDLGNEIKKLKTQPKTAEIGWDLNLLNGQLAVYTKKLEQINKDLDGLERKMSGKVPAQKTIEMPRIKPPEEKKAAKLMP